MVDVMAVRELAQEIVPVGVNIPVGMFAEIMRTPLTNNLTTIYYA